MRLYVYRRAQDVEVWQDVTRYGRCLTITHGADVQVTACWRTACHPRDMWFCMWRYVDRRSPHAPACAHWCWRRLPARLRGSVTPLKTAL